MCYNGYPGKPGYHYPSLSEQKREIDKKKKKKTATENISLIIEYAKNIIKGGR